jgi:hypothetical protein
MHAIDYRHLSPAERLDLMGEIRDSIEADHLLLTAKRTAELNRCVAILDEHLHEGRDGYIVLADLSRPFWLKHVDIIPPAEAEFAAGCDFS